MNSRNLSTRVQQKILHNIFDICNSSPEDALIAARDMTFTDAHFDGNGDDKDGKNVMEIPCLEVPVILPNSYAVQSEAPSDFEDDDNDNVRIYESFWAEEIGPEDLVWDKITESLEAEISASSDNTSVEHLIVKTDEEHQRRIHENKMPRKPAIRALEEPFVISMDLLNTLSIPLSLTELHLTARHESSDGVTSNINAKLENFRENTKNEKYSFQGSKENFYVPHFFSYLPNSTTPSFVVNMQKIDIEAKSVVKLYMHICPLVPGKLKIVGMRCKLFGKLWIYHQFDLVGPLLQKTREQRANRGKFISFFRF